MENQDTGQNKTKHLIDDIGTENKQMKIKWRTWETKKEETINRLRDKVTKNYCETIKQRKKNHKCPSNKKYKNESKPFNKDFFW